MIKVGDTVTINGEVGEWKVDRGPNGAIVHLIQNGNSGILRSVNIANLTLVSSAIIVNPRPT
jgi:hypothetical protein